MTQQEKRAWIDVGIAALIATFLLQSRLFALFFLVPLQSIRVRRGHVAFWYAAASMIAFVAGLKLVQMTRLGIGFDAAFFFLDLFVPISLCLGLWLIDAPVLASHKREYKLIAATALGSVGVLPVFGVLASAEVLTEVVQAQIVMLAGGSELVNSGVIDEIVTTAITALYGSFSLGIAVVLGAGWYLGTVLALRGTERVEDAPSLLQFRTEPRLIWAFLVSWAIALIGFYVDIGLLRPVATNIGLVLALIYAVQGVGIIRFLMARFGLGRGARIGIGIAAFFVVLIPGLNLVVVFGVPGLGLAELWVNFGRTETNSKEAE